MVEGHEPQDPLDVRLFGAKRIVLRAQRVPNNPVQGLQVGFSDRRVWLWHAATAVRGRKDRLPAVRSRSRSYRPCRCWIVRTVSEETIEHPDPEKRDGGALFCVLPVAI